MKYKGFTIVKEKHSAGGIDFEWTVYDAEGFPLDSFITKASAIYYIDRIR